MRIRRRTVASFVMVAALVAALGTATGCGASPAAPEHPAAGFDAQAKFVLAQWPKTSVARVWDSAFIPLEDQIVVPPESEFTPVEVSALAARDFAYPAVLPPLPAANGQIAFPDGTTLSVPLRRADVMPYDTPAVNARGGPCTASMTSFEPAGCSLTVTKITLGSTPLRTSRGEAQVPAWILTVRQIADPLALVAVAQSATVSFQDRQMVGVGDPADVGWVGNLTSIKGAALDYTVLTSDCADQIRPLAYETSSAVVIGASDRITAGICDAMLKGTPASIHLKAPVGNRVVLDIYTGYPVMLTNAYRQSTF